MIRCLHDYLEIRDGGGEESPLIGRFCGTQGPPPIHLSGNEVYIKFVSDVSTTDSGFELVYTKQPPGTTLIDFKMDQLIFF